MVPIYDAMDLANRYADERSGRTVWRPSI